jgi:hypothetical protein
VLRLQFNCKITEIMKFMHRKIAKSYDNLRSITFMQIKYREILHRSQITFAEKFRNITP